MREQLRHVEVLFNFPDTDREEIYCGLFPIVPRAGDFVRILDDDCKPVIVGEVVKIEWMTYKHRIAVYVSIRESAQNEEG